MRRKKNSRAKAIFVFRRSPKAAFVTQGAVASRTRAPHLAEAAARLPEVESELTRRMDEMEDTAETGVAQLERAT